MLADANEVIETQRGEYEALAEEVEEERAARKSVEAQAEATQQTLSKAIDYRQSKRAESRGYLEQMQPVVIERPPEVDDGTD
jgi:hypothetical protein